MTLALIKLIQLADSAAPIGWAAHSMGLESAVEERGLNVDDLPRMLAGWLSNSVAFEAAYCRRAFHLPAQVWLPDWYALNDELSAIRISKESRAASATLGRRFLTLVANLERSERLLAALDGARSFGSVTHHCAAFGLVAATLGVDAQSAVEVYVQQSAAAMVSAAQRLLPLGQTRASQILWDLKQEIMRAARDLEPSCCFTPLLDIASMRHPDIPTRLFIS